MSIILATGNRRSPLAERGHDLYETPAVAVQALLRVERLPHVIWEPAAGRGAIVQVLRVAGHRVVAQDLEQSPIRLTISRICQVCGAFSFGDLIETRGDGLAEACDGECAVLERI
jgi:hypothetical protein